MERVRSLLSQIPLFAELPPQALDQLAGAARIETVRAKIRVVEKGARGDRLFGVLSGRLKVSSTSTEGDEVAFTILGEGAVFGEISLLDGAARSATVTTISPATLVVLERTIFLALVEANPKIAMKLLQSMAGRLRALSQRLEDRAFLDIRARLAKQLVWLAEHFGRQLADGQVALEFKLSQQELGDLVGATRESINKHLRDWNKSGILTVDSRSLVIHELKTLTEIARSSTCD